MNYCDDAEACDGYPVYYAAAKGSVEKVRELIARGQSPDRSPAGCPPPLYRAIRFNNPDVALTLIQAGCRVQMSKRNSLIISIAAELNMTEVVLKLCDNPDCDAFATNSQLRTIVHLAVAHRNHDLVRQLPSHLSPGKFLSLRDGQCLTPLHVAASLGDVTMLKLLLMWDERVGSLLIAASSDTDATPQQVGVCRNFLTGAVPVTAACPELNGQTAEDQLVSVRSSDAVPEEKPPAERTGSMSESQSVAATRLVTSTRESESPSGEDARGVDTKSRSRDGADCRTHSESRVGEAARSERRDDVSACSESKLDSSDKASVDYKSRSSMRTKYEFRSKSDADADADGGSWEDSASLPAPRKVRRELLDLPVLGSKETMLHFAAKGGHLETVEFLLAQGADVNARNLMNNSPLHLLCLHGRADHR